jgi:hypothetical protein
MKERTREDVAVECLERGDISVDDQGRFWRHRKRVGGMAHKVVEVRRERAEYVSKSGRLELKVYENGWRYTCQCGYSPTARFQKGIGLHTSAMTRQTIGYLT